MSKKSTANMARRNQVDLGVPLLETGGGMTDPVLPMGHSAVMAGRQATETGDLDYFPTPPWAARAGFEVLPHKSRECVCVNSAAEDLQLWPESVIARVEAIETAAGFSAAGKPKTMFRPARKMGATGIREVIRWAYAGRGKYRPLDDGLGPTAAETGCDGGFCAS